MGKYFYLQEYFFKNCILFKTPNSQNEYNVNNKRKRLVNSNNLYRSIFYKKFIL